MEVKLSSTTAIVEKMKSLGKDSSFKNRAKTFKDMGLEDRLGKYVGSMAQNMAFIDVLDTKTLLGGMNKEEALKKLLESYKQ